MQYASDPNGQDIVSATRFYSDTVVSDYGINDVTRNINVAYHKLAALIATSDGTWQWDDANNTTLPVAYTDLVANQKDYTLDDNMLEIERIEAKNVNGIWELLTPLDKNYIPGAVDEFMKVSSTPLYYDRLGRTIFLYPASSVAVTGGLKVHLIRSANIFSVSDTTREPGFVESFHDYLPTYAALVYCELYKPKRVPMLLDRLNRMEMDIKRFYGRRSRDVKTRLQGYNETNV